MEQAWYEFKGASSGYYEECKTQEVVLNPNVIPEESPSASGDIWLEVGLLIAGFVLTFLGAMAGAYRYSKKKNPSHLNSVPDICCFPRILNQEQQPHPHHQPYPMSQQLEQMHSASVFQPHHHHPNPALQPCQFHVNTMVAPRMGPPTPYSVNQSWNKSRDQQTPS